MPEEDLVELKFRLYDGTDIGPIQYAGASTVQMLKERIFSEWPRDKKMIPKTANDLRLISAGKILENNKTVAQCRVPFGELPGGVITMHVVVQPSLVKMKTAFLASLCGLGQGSRTWGSVLDRPAPNCSDRLMPIPAEPMGVGSAPSKKLKIEDFEGDGIKEFSAVILDVVGIMNSTSQATHSSDSLFLKRIAEVHGHKCTRHQQ